MAIGFDAGTYNLICCTRGEEDKVIKRGEVNAFLKMPLDNRFVFNMMKNAGVPLIEWKEENAAFALGKAAVDLAYTMTQIELKRPMKDGCLNPKEKMAQAILAKMIHGLLADSVKTDNETLYYSVPANALNEDTDADYHQKILEAIFNDFNKGPNGKPIGNIVDAHPINEGLALVYAELASENWTGIGVSCLIPGTKVYTDKGIVPIEEVNPGDKVITHKGRWRPVFNTISKHFSGVSTKIQIQGYSDNTEEYQFVDNHELYVLRDGEWKWTGCEEIVDGDIVGEPILYQDKSKNRPTMTICERSTCSKVYTKKQYEVTGNIQRLIGYFLGDGSVNLSEGCIQFDFGSHESNNISDVKQILKKAFGKNTSECKKDSDCIRVKCYSKGLANWFKNHCYTDDGDKKYPWGIDRIGHLDCVNLLSGLVRSDGELGDGYISFGNTNTHLIQVVKQLFSRLGHAASISWRPPRRREFENRIIEGKKNEWTVQTHTKMSTNSLAETIGNINCDNCRFYEKMFIRDGFCCGRVQKIEHEDYEGTVHDLQVEEDHSFSGPYLTISNCGAGMVNLCFAMFGAPIFEFSIVNSGDWIDKQAAKATGETPTFINREKLKTDLSDKHPESLIQRAIHAQYEIMIQKTVSVIKQGLEEAGNKARADKPISVVIAGGTSSPNGFDTLFADILAKANVPIEIGKVIRPKDPLYSVARGCLVAAENAVG